MYDKTLGPTVDPSGLQGPPGSSLCQSVIWVNPLVEVLGSLASNAVAKRIPCKILSCW